jgi:hypothetical protein
VVGLFKDVANGVVGLDNPVADAIVHNGLNAAIDHALPGPDPTDTVLKNLDAKSTVENSLRSALAAGYYKHGVITTAPPSDIISNGHLIPYTDLPDTEARNQYNAWMNTQSVTNVVDPAYDKLSNAFSEAGIDAF